MKFILFILFRLVLFVCHIEILQTVEPTARIFGILASSWTGVQYLRFKYSWHEISCEIVSRLIHDGDSLLIWGVGIGDFVFILQIIPNSEGAMFDSKGGQCT